MDRKKIKETAKLFADHCLGQHERNKILVLTDDGVECTDALGQMRDAVIEVLKEDGLDLCVLSFRAGKDTEIPALAEAACLESDILLSFNTNLLLYSRNFPKIYQGGKTNRRLALFPAGSSIRGETNYFERMMPDTEEEIHQMAEITRRYGNFLMDGSEHHLHLTAANGTDLTLTVGQLSGSAHCGICAPGTIELIPAGILSLGIEEGSAEGTLVTDYSTTLWKKPLQGKIWFEVHDGFASSISGGTEAGEFLAAAAKVSRPDREKFNIAEFGLGFNPRAKADGQVTDGENIFGGAHIGIGSNLLFGGNVDIPEWHIDCMIPNAAVEADEKLILKDGTYFY